jgi:hypothetical protein
MVRAFAAVGDTHPDAARRDARQSTFRRAGRFRRRRSLVGLIIPALALAASLAAASPVAASTTASLSMTERGPYACLGPCESATYFNLHGLADSAAFGVMTYTGQGTVLGYDPDTNCLSQSENYAFTMLRGHSGDTLWLSTTSDTFCFTSDPNVSFETATFTVTGGTGRFSDATGGGSFSLRVLTHPQRGSGTITGSVTY